MLRILLKPQILLGVNIWLIWDSLLNRPDNIFKQSRNKPTVLNLLYMQVKLLNHGITLFFLKNNKPILNQEHLSKTPIDK